MHENARNLTGPELYKLFSYDNNDVSYETRMSYQIKNPDEQKVLYNTIEKMIETVSTGPEFVSKISEIINGADIDDYTRNYYATPNDMYIIQNSWIFTCLIENNKIPVLIYLLQNYKYSFGNSYCNNYAISTESELKNIIIALMRNINGLKIIQRLTKMDMNFDSSNVGKYFEEFIRTINTLEWSEEIKEQWRTWVKKYGEAPSRH